MTSTANPVAELRRRGTAALATGDPQVAARLAADVVHAYQHAADLAASGWPEPLAVEYGCAAAADCDLMGCLLTIRDTEERL